MYERLRKILPILVGIMAVIFAVLYWVFGRQYGVAYQDTLYLPTTQGETVTYTGKAEGQTASFTVEPGGAVTYRWGDAVYGPYLVQEDPTAVPQEWKGMLTGVEVRLGDEVLFRGGYLLSQGSILIQSDGQTYSAPLINFTINGVTYGADGEPVDPGQPDLSGILLFSGKPEANDHRGNLQFFAIGTFAAAVCIVTALFADQLFRFNLSFQIKHPDDAEPSEWEITSRVLGWLVLTGLSFGTYLAGLLTISN